MERALATSDVREEEPTEKVSNADSRTARSTLGGIDATAIARTLDTSGFARMIERALDTSGLVKVIARAIDTSAFARAIDTSALARDIDTSAIAKMYGNQLRAIDTTAIVRMHGNQLKAIDTTAIARMHGNQLKAIDTTAIVRAYVNQQKAIDTSPIAGMYASQLKAIDTSAILMTYRASIARFLVSQPGGLTVTAAAKAVAEGGNVADQAPPIVDLSAQQVGALTEAMTQLPALEEAPAVEPEGDLEWLVSAMIASAVDTNENAQSRVQQAVITLAIVAALTAVIAASPTLMTAFNYLSVPVTLWPFIARLVSEDYFQGSEDSE